MYLTVYSTLHLLGYDHVDEAEMKRQMRGERGCIMSGLGIWSLLGEKERYEKGFRRRAPKLCALGRISDLLEAPLQTWTPCMCCAAAWCFRCA